MKTINVYQCELDKEIPLEYIGRVKYIGDNVFITFTDGKEYDVVYNTVGNIAIVDDEGEDYIHSLSDPTYRSKDNINGKFEIVDDPRGILKKYIK